MNAAPRAVAEVLASDPFVVAAIERAADGEADEQQAEAVCHLINIRIVQAFGELPGPGELEAVGAELAEMLGAGGAT